MYSKTLWNSPLMTTQKAFSKSLHPERGGGGEEEGGGNESEINK